MTHNIGPHKYTERLLTPDADPTLAELPRAGDIQAVTRCAAILAALSDHESLRAADVAAELGLDRSTAHRYLTSMQRAQLVERRASDGSFVPGPLVVRVGAFALAQSRVIEYASPLMAILSAEVHQTVVLSIWGGTAPVVTRVCEDAGRLVHVSVREGSRLPLRAAQTVVFLAYLADRELVRRLIGELPNALRTELENDIESARRLGMSENTIITEGIRAVAVPVFDSLGAIRATIALVGTADAISRDPDASGNRALRAAAGRISSRLGYTDLSGVDEMEQTG